MNPDSYLAGGEDEDYYHYAFSPSSFRSDSTASSIATPDVGLAPLVAALSNHPSVPLPTTSLATTTTTAAASSSSSSTAAATGSASDRNARVRKTASLALINVPSFSAFRSQLPSAIKRPHAQTLSSPRPLTFSPAKPSPSAAELAARPISLDGSPDPTLLSRELSLPPSARGDHAETTPKPHTRIASSHARTASIDTRITESRSSSIYSDTSRRSSIPIHAVYSQGPTVAHAPRPSVTSLVSGNPYSPDPSHAPSSSMGAAQQPAPMTSLQLDGIKRTRSDESLEAPSPAQPKSPGPAGRLGTFFGWKAPRSDTESSPTTTFSDRSLSPLPSPGMAKSAPVDGMIAPARLTPSALEIHKHDRAATYFDNPVTPLLLGDHATNAHVRELEGELAHVSQELAESIRREMELEDELDRVRAEFSAMHAVDSNRRGSDYFSDSGMSMTRFPITDIDGKIEQLEKQLRKAEQHKANLQVETASRVQTELSRRRDLEELVRDLEDQVQKYTTDDTPRGSQDGRVEELETILDETRRRLGQEKQTKDNFEDLYSATKEALEKYRNEADSLRDEVVPQLKARIEGLEADAVRMQTEMSSLRGDEGGVSPAIMSPRQFGLNRSASLARSGSRYGGSISGPPKSDTGRQRSGSIGYSDAVKDVEDQRDALHKALKLLISRHEKQQREHTRAVQRLNKSRDLADSPNPRHNPYQREVTFLKEEVTTLRKRTEDALEQKWQYEKNLSGLKFDLDRAEQETRGLRILLRGRDSQHSSSESGEDEPGDRATQSITTAETERDNARSLAEEYRRRASSAPAGDATNLMDRAKRMDELADQLDAHVQSNVQFQERLSVAVAKGEQEQRESTRKIQEMQKRLMVMEDSVLAAQQHSETALATHDTEMRQIEAAASPRLQRFTLTASHPHLPLSAGKTATPSPMLSPMFRPSRRNSKLHSSQTSLLEMSRTQLLERKVKDLEALLREAEEDMQTVVQRVTRGQYDVAQLQTERDAALSQMRKLQALVVEERTKADLS